MYNEAARYLLDNITSKPSIGIVLGSGLGELADKFDTKTYFNYKDLPGFLESTVEGHLGRFVLGEFSGKTVMAMQGRFHFYEGYDAADIVLPIRVLKLLGINTLILTNAAGGVNLTFKPGDLMIITDHINLTNANSLRGKNDSELGVRFPDMSSAYDKVLVELAKTSADKLGLEIKSGVYAMMSGPSYETPAEIRMLRVLGADAVGMSTVPEAIAAVHSGMKVLGISCITNMAAGILPYPLSHSEVIETADKAKHAFADLISCIVKEL